MTRRQLLRAGALAALSGFVAPVVRSGGIAFGGLLAAIQIPTRTVDLVLGSPVIDMLGLLTMDWAKLWRWQRDPEMFDEADFRRLEGSGVNVFHPAVKTVSDDAHATARRWLSGWNRLLGATPCFLDRIDTMTDLRLARQTGRLGVIVGFQDSDHFRTAADVETFHALGQRVSQLTYNEHNRLGSGCYMAVDRGLTPFGAEVIGSMNRVGMAIDLSHCGERTTLDAIETSRAPVLVTHSNCRALVPAQPRCKSDKVIRRLASRGGVIGITSVKAFVGSRQPTVDDLLNHFDHVAHVAGAEHVGLGSDLDVTAIDPRSGRLNPFYDIRGLVPPARVYQIADGLLARGWLPGDVEGVLGGNFARVLSAAWPQARRKPPEWEARRDPFCPAPLPFPSEEVDVVAHRTPHAKS